MSSISVGTPALRVSFEKRDDRYIHQVSRHFPNGTGGLLISHESKPDDPWPTSPALQSLHLETQPGKGQIAMLVGMAGRSHWSMTVEVDATQNALLFDVACRVHESPLWLGSTYHGLNQQGAAWPLDYLSLSAWEGNASEKQILIQFDRRSGNVRIPAPSAIGSFPQTIRWRYAIALTQQLPA
ncbi:MAG TPA: hypothetical protein VFE46_12440 [Pirellulales bacterium]|jgi:hypothetical protein|nr:hypothetical protein [Pirellulales bacterium]